MATYDPKRQRRSPAAVPEEAPVDRLLDAATPPTAGREESAPSHEPSEPTAVPVVPDIGEADPDLRLKIGVMGGVAAAIAIIGAWVRRRQKR